ncbi:TetR/AcrR family transcriptional regulator [Allohahella marinimesophila]|uniref:HTH tetR-type domain-containing protein n=1 Tax=Allohahella marinimesophila TaxID=1054972 RepID=A0ABP7P161_9GAMM
MSRSIDENSVPERGSLAERLIIAAEKLIECQGDFEFSMRGLAAHVGASPMAAYCHFDNKINLLQAVAGRGFYRLQQATQTAVRSAGDDPLQQLENGGVAYVQFGYANPALYRLMFGPTLVAETTACFEKARHAGWSVLADTMQRCAERGYIEPESVERQAVYAWSMSHGLTMLMIDRSVHMFHDLGHKPCDIEQFIRCGIQQMCASIRYLKLETPDSC